MVMPLPDVPAENRSRVINYLNENPELWGFIERFDAHVKSLYPDATTSIQWVYFDEWDPPIMVEAIATLPADSDYFAEMQKIREWAKADPAWNKQKIIASLLRRSATMVSPL